MLDTCGANMQLVRAERDAADMLHALTRTIETAMAVATQADAVTVDEAILQALTCTNVSEASTKFRLSHVIRRISLRLLFFFLFCLFWHISFIFKN